MQMLRDRGYLVSNDKLNETLEEFQKEFGEGESVRRDDLTIFVPKVEDPQDQVKCMNSIIIAITLMQQVAATDRSL